MQAQPTNNTETTETKRKKRTRYFETYILKLIRVANHGITSNGKQQLNSLICVLAQRLSEMSRTLTGVANKKTLSDKEVESATQLLLTGELLEKALILGKESVSKYREEAKNKGEEAKHNSRQEKAGILFPPSVTEKFLRDMGNSKVMVTKTAPVFLATVLEHISNRIIENALERTKSEKRVRITIRDMELGVRNDTDLNELFQTCNIQFIGGGVVPFIHSRLLLKMPRKKKAGTAPAGSGGEESSLKKHRFRQGTVALRDIRKLQRLSNCLTFAKFPFEKFTRQLVNSHQKMKVSGEMFVVLQYYIEQFLIEFLRKSNLIALHADKVRLMPEDIRFLAELENQDLVWENELKLQITSPAVTRLARKAGVKSLSETCLDTILNLASVRIDQVVRNAIVVNSQRHTKTLMAEDLYDSLALMGENLLQSTELGKNTVTK